MNDRSQCSSNHLRAKLVGATLQVAPSKLGKIRWQQARWGHLRAKLDEGERELAGKVVEANLQLAPN